MKKYFITGLVILLPLALTILVVTFFFNLLTEPFLGLTRAVMEHYGLMHSGFLFLSAANLQTVVSKILILITLFLFTVFLGFVARWFFFHYILRFWESMIQKIPFVNSIYSASKDVIKTVFSSKKSAFKQVVMVRFPNPDTKTIGLVTRDDFPAMHSSLDEDLLVVFVPTTPNPTSGFLTIVKRKDAIFLDMSIEEAFKYIISCGVIMPIFKENSAPKKSLETGDFLILDNDNGGSKTP